MKFELTNEQRKYLGLEIVPKSWEKFQITEEVYVYFDGNIIRKKVSVNENLYREIQLVILKSSDAFIVAIPPPRE